MTKISHIYSLIIHLYAWARRSILIIRIATSFSGSFARFISLNLSLKWPDIVTGALRLIQLLTVCTCILRLRSIKLIVTFSWPESAITIRIIKTRHIFLIWFQMLTLMRSIPRILKVWKVTNISFWLNAFTIESILSHLIDVIVLFIWILILNIWILEKLVLILIFLIIRTELWIDWLIANI